MEDGRSEGLSPRSVGQLLDDNFRFYRKKFGFLMVSGLCFLIPYHILNAYITIHYNLADFSAKLQQLGQPGAAGANPQAMSLSEFWSPGLTWTLALTIIYSLLVTPLLLGMIVHMVTNHHLANRQINLGDASTHAFRRLVPGILTTIMLGLTYFVIVFGMIVLSALVAAIAHSAAVPVMIFAFVLITGVFLWLAVRLSLVPSVVIEEQMMLLRAFTRSWQLTMRNFWRTTGYFLLLFILVGILRSAILVGAVAFVHNQVLVAVISTIIDVLVIPFFMLGTSNLYVDLRVRRDG